MRKLGRGGMADVYAARQLSLERDVALKVLRSDFARDEDYVHRFRREAKSAAKLSHPNIVHVHDVGNVESLHYIAQELIDGENLREHLDRHGAVSLEDAIQILTGVASALEAASDAGITHRDIKPENIMRTSRGTIKVADFGLARLGADVAATRADLTQAGLTLGTPRYMSPEQVQGKPVDVRSDLYSLGVSMYHLLTGRPPFEADDPLALAVMHLHETPQPLDRTRNQSDAEGNPDLPEWLIAVISRLMNKLPQDRYQSATELLDAIQNEAPTSSIGGFGVGTAAATTRLQRAADEARRHRRRRWLRIAGIILLPLACTASAAAVAFQRKPAKVSEILRPETVPQADTVQEQYFNAVIRNDEAGWNSVSNYFPLSANATNASYSAKARLQLANFYLSDNRLQEADAILDDVFGDPSIDRIYQVAALSRRVFVLEQIGRSKRAADAKQQLHSMYTDLTEDNPKAARLLERWLTKSELAQLGLEDT